MTIVMKSIFRVSALAAVWALPIVGSAARPATGAGQAQAASSAARQIGTVKAISGNSITLTADGGTQVSVTVADGARIVQLAPGSTDLKSAQPIALNEITVGDRVLVAGKAGEDGSLSAARIILMKSSDIAERRQAEQADWQRRGSGGLVNAVDASSGSITMSVGARKIDVKTSAKTQFRRYSGDSVKFEDAKPGTLAQILPGDQMRVLGDKSADGASIQADVIVSGTFKHLAGTIATIDAAAGTLTLKDLATKQTMTVRVTASSDVRKLPERAAAMLAARAKGGAAASGSAEGHRAEGQGAPGSAAPGNGGRQGGDLSQMLARFPTETLSDLKVGDAVMIVASQPDAGSPTVTAVTMLSGVEPILAAAPGGSTEMTLSPWSVGGGGPEAGATD